MKSFFLSLAILILQAPSPAPQETAVIEGNVTKIGTAQPVARARVTLTTDGRPAVTMTVTTDGGGKFLFQNVQPGRYRLYAVRDGYLRAEYGQPGPSVPGTSINVASRQELKDLRLQMT